MRVSSDDWIVRTDTGGVLSAEVAGLVAADETGGLDGRGRATRKASVEVHNALHAGGILGGISTGQPIVLRFSVKPTSSITTPRRTIDRHGKEIDLITKGRHDPCVGIRAVPVAEAMAACVILDHLLMDRAQTGGQRGRIGELPQN